MDEVTGLLNDFQVENILPDLEPFVGKILFLLRLLVMVGPLTLFGLGVWYLFLPPKEANYRVGFRTPWGMGSVAAWHFVQRIAGMAFTALGFLLSTIMAIICSRYRKIGLWPAAQSAFRCLIWEVVLILICTIAIQVTAAVFYDWHGVPRDRKPKQNKYRRR